MTRKKPLKIKFCYRSNKAHTSEMEDGNSTAVAATKNRKKVLKLECIQLQLL